MQSGVAAELGGSAPVRRRMEGPSPASVTIPEAPTPVAVASAAPALTPPPVPAAAPTKLNGHDGWPPRSTPLRAPPDETRCCGAWVCSWPGCIPCRHGIRWTAWRWT
jgi:hypothetical protein